MDYRFLLQNDKYIKDEIHLIKPSSGHIRACAIYPNHYDTAMSSLGFHFLYESLNAWPELSVERCYLPGEKSIKLVCSKYLSSFETATPLVNFNILAFSVSYETDFINVLRILKLAKVPFSREERLAGGYPLLICGGPATFQNIVPMYEIFDVFSVGAGEITIGTVVSKYIELAGQRKGTSEINREIMRALGGADNFFVPSQCASMKGSKIVRCAAPAENKYAKTVILTPHTEFKMRALIETVRGCVRRCKFCMVGSCYGRFRYNPAEDIYKYIESVLTHTRKIGLLGPAVSAHPDLVELYKNTRERKLDISMSSVYINEISGELIRMLSENEQKNITVAVESACEEVRNAVSKNLADADIFENLDKALECGIKNFKIYFILGLYDFFGKSGGDEAGDTAAFIARLEGYLTRRRPDARLKISINPLVVKPRTPMCYAMPQNAGFFDFYSGPEYITELEARYKRIASELKSSNIEFSEKNFADSALLKLINECGVNLFDFFDDFFYNESKNSRAVIKIMRERPEAFDPAAAAEKLFAVDFVN
ncbi:MAG: hypothetical protein A2008_05560 [Candidatus Wallbacteria bacterium GWC2_49_35]|uniref:Radical SAM core domain-containing protein n=1 Tax=Candidatus Wallbacteria bacterium GWC2_49_35 TaxID=1817813 RepID=A0A1F7WPC1_9BACT|nr:MAG: hypothetical protein A2008_05560 [Candidatus Wallbacteria bacterium GWC2_49_35]